LLSACKDNDMSGTLECSINIHISIHHNYNTYVHESQYFEVGTVCGISNYCIICIIRYTVDANKINGMCEAHSTNSKGEMYTQF